MPDLFFVLRPFKNVSMGMGSANVKRQQAFTRTFRGNSVFRKSLIFFVCIFKELLHDLILKIVCCCIVLKRTKPRFEVSTLMSHEQIKKIQIVIEPKPNTVCFIFKTRNNDGDDGSTVCTKSSLI